MCNFNIVFLLCLFIIFNKGEDIENDYGLIEDENFGQDYCEASYPLSSVYEPLKQMDLVLVHLMTRHGDRSPIFTVDRKDINLNSPFDCPLEEIKMDNNINYTQDSTFGECSVDSSQQNYCSINPFIQNRVWGNSSCLLGQLTRKGSTQLMNIGEQLRIIYTQKMDFLSKDTSKILDEIHTRSTDFHRTKQSAASLLTKLTQSTQPKKIQVVDEMFETISPSSVNCPTLIKVVVNTTKTIQYKEFMNKFEAHKTRIMNILKSKIEIIDNEVFVIEALLDVIWSRHCSKFPVICNPENKEDCIDEKLLDIILKFSNIEARILNRDNVFNIPIGARLKMGGFLLEIKRNIIAKINNSLIKESLFNKFKLIYYSAHDSSLSALLGALQSMDMRWPPYASNMLIELWKPKTTDNSNKDPFENYMVRFIYNGKPLVTSWCSSPLSEGTCTVKDFVDYLDNTLHIIGGFENYIHDPKFVWNQYNECHNT